MSASKFLALVVLAGAALVTSGPAAASTGHGDSNVFALNTRLVSAVDNRPPSIVDPFVGPCAPNPFNPATVIPFGIAGSGPVRLLIHDLRGRVVRVLVDEVDPAPGLRQAIWDGRDDHGHEVASGL